MAKKSAKSKGYRKTVKPAAKGFTKKEWMAILVTGVLIVLAVAAAVGIPALVESSKNLRLKDGVVQGVGDNWLICNLGTRNKPQYRKLAEINGAAEGFVLSEAAMTRLDSNMPLYLFVNEAEDAAAHRYVVQSASGNAKSLMHQYAANMAEKMSATAVSAGERETSVNGLDVYMTIVTYTYNTADDSETPVYSYEESAIAYIDSTLDGVSVAVNIMNSYEDSSSYASEDALYAILEEAVATVTMCER